MKEPGWENAAAATTSVLRVRDCVDEITRLLETSARGYAHIQQEGGQSRAPKAVLKARPRRPGRTVMNVLGSRGMCGQALGTELKSMCPCRVEAEGNAEAWDVACNVRDIRGTRL